MAIINAFIVHNYHRAATGKPRVSHVTFLKTLHLQLCQLLPEDWVQLLRHRGHHATPTRARQARAAHMPVQADEWRKGNSDKTRKRRQRACKVCSVLKGAATSRGGETTFYCAECKLKTTSRHELAARVFLCNKVKHCSKGEPTSCWDIWHKHWKNGTMIPQSGRKRKIRARKPARAASDGGSDASDSESQSRAEIGSVSSQGRSGWRPHTNDDGS